MLHYNIEDVSSSLCLALSHFADIILVAYNTQRTSRTFWIILRRMLINPRFNKATEVMFMSSELFSTEASMLFLETHIML
jgi:hypothetical protein